MIEYFIKNSRLNYALLVFILFMGINSYINIPKEMFPDMELDKISVIGSYRGASANTMDKMAVRDIEDSLSDINGIDKSETTISPGAFAIVLTLSKGANRELTLSRVKDSVALSRQNLPSDMDEPVTTLLEKTKPLIKLAVSSSTLSIGELTVIAQDMKSKVAKVSGVGEVLIRGDSDEQVTIKINSEAILAYGLDHGAVLKAIANISYIFPIGDIEQRGNFVFVSTANGKADVDGYKEAILNIDNRYVKLSDIADIIIEYPQTDTLATYNGKKTISLTISKGTSGDAIVLAKTLQKYVAGQEKNYKDVDFTFYEDSSKPIKDRLDIIISNLMLGLTLVLISMFILINLRIALIVALGIPFSFLIGITFLYYMGYSINVISLLGGLIVIGIVVDDAIVVSENIQRYIDEGMDRYEATIRGTKEMILPVTLATLTTVVAFLPIFMMQGETALFILLIPITVIIILLGSLLESFLFLPLHAYEFLKPSKNLVNWTPLQNMYERVVLRFLHFKKISIFFFLVLIPLISIYMASTMRFQFFPNFDGNFLYISGKIDINTPLEETYKISQEIENELLKHKEEFSLKAISSFIGYRRSLSGETQRNSGVFMITMELHDRASTNFVDSYITPILNLNFNFNDPLKIRKEQTYELSPKAREIIKEFKSKYNMEDLGVMEDKPGLIRSDIEINLSGMNDELLQRGIKKLEQKIKTIEGIRDFSDNIKLGKMEYKIKINSYGESLGLSEASIARTLSAYFLEQKQTTTFNERGVMEIKTEDIKKDSIDTLLNFSIAFGEGKSVKLTQVADIIEIRDYEKINKLNGSIIKTFFASIDKRKTTSGEVLDQLEPTLDELRASGVDIMLLGEKEKREQLKDDMQKAILLALFLIFLSLLIIFPKIKYALMVMSVIPLSVLGAFIGHKLLGLNLSMASIIGILGLAGVVVNDGIIMINFLHGTHKLEEFLKRAKLRLRPIIITTLTTFLGLFTLIFYATGQAVILQPIAISIGFGLIWGTILNLIYLPMLYALVNKIEPKRVI
ncbi:MAG TPA: efflux RND transporter permease subunit [Sulfurimonas sp.]|uniref:efflux RND transporter permease subunit n=1 Tax=Sulfurimonas sp. TaxID=2022749 RepID=UPI002BCF2B8A|nr:efflux RND transporter permease subunit [Sulfurimonas sp.]HUH41839.1 efflux RND transporter permease subunit [Sulfurimonas sp.]